MTHAAYAHASVTGPLEAQARLLSSALTAFHPETALHCARVARLAVRLGRELQLTVTELWTLKLGALLHDVGKLGVSTPVLDKTMPLSADEWAQLRAHAEIGSNLVRDHFPDVVCRMVAEHHERWDGEGYPRGLRGNQISLGARIIAVVDTFDAITCDRAYRTAAPYAHAVHEIEGWAGQQFDPYVVEAFLRIPRTELLPTDH